ncbi:DUF501 domain-containing protein [Pontibacter sp. JAM-7]|uniref:DUF501 domain-containing protein n=1 Tax=Pontibacter sp. JAM-7 TaxID=3366581 RepID=UPI003AF9255D
MSLITPTAEQFETIRQQLGREPRGLAGIALASTAGIPLVLQMRSLVDDQPFPTLYWLSSRELYQAIAEIETAGAVKQLEQALQSDAAFMAEHLVDQQRYVDLRWQLMTSQDRQRIAELGFTSLFDQYGIGGIRHWDKIRCLHMQYAFHTVAGSAVGRRLDELFQLDQLACES